MILKKKIGKFLQGGFVPGTNKTKEQIMAEANRNRDIEREDQKQQLTSDRYFQEYQNFTNDVNKRGVGKSPWAQEEAQKYTKMIHDAKRQEQLEVAAKEAALRSYRTAETPNISRTTVQPIATNPIVTTPQIAPQIATPVSSERAKTRGDAFRMARERRDRNFEWNGEKFHTRLKGESDSAYESFLTGNSNTGQGSQTNSGNTENIVNTSNQDSQTNQTGQNPSAGTTIATKEIEILDPRKNSFWDNSTGKNSGVDLTVRGDAGNEWTGRRWRNQAANFATLKSGDDTWERVIHNGDTRYVLNGRTSRGTDPSIIALFDSLDRADSESIANEPKKHPSDNWLNNFFKRTLSPYDNNRSSGVKASFQQGGQMPQISEEEVLMDFAVRYFTALGADDIVDDQGNLNPAYTEELTEVMNSGVDLEAYVQAPDEYIAQIVAAQNPQAVEIARKGAKLRKLRSIKFLIK